MPFMVVRRVSGDHLFQSVASRRGIDVRDVGQNALPSQRELEGLEVVRSPNGQCETVHEPAMPRLRGTSCAFGKNPPELRSLLVVEVRALASMRPIAKRG